MIVCVVLVHSFPLCIVFCCKNILHYFSILLMNVVVTSPTPFSVTDNATLNNHMQISLVCVRVSLLHMLYAAAAAAAAKSL